MKDEVSGRGAEPAWTRQSCVKTGLQHRKMVTHWLRAMKVGHWSGMRAAVLTMPEVHVEEHIRVTTGGSIVSSSCGGEGGA